MPERFRGLSEAELAIKVLEGYCGECYGQPWKDGSDSVHYPWCPKRPKSWPMDRYSEEYYQNFTKEQQ